MKKFCQFTLSALMLSSISASGALIAYWDQNSNGLPNGGFGYLTTSFPQAADQGSGSLYLEDFDTTTFVTTGGDTSYLYIESFGGNALNAQPSIVAGGSISPEGGLADGLGGFSNNGMSIVLQVSTMGFTDLSVSWAQRGTSSGFTTRQFDYSTDGATWTNFGTDTGALGSTWVTESYDLSSVASIENQATVYFRIVLDGATGTSGNNRFDNITVEGVPEPTTALLGALGVLGLLRRRR